MNPMNPLSDKFAAPGLQTNQQALVENLKQAVTQASVPPQAVEVSRGGTDKAQAPSATRPPILDMPLADQEDVSRALMEVQMKLQDQQLKLSTNDIKGMQAKNKAMHEQRIEKLQESIDKMAEAKKGGLFAKIFGWIATIATVIASVALIATGVGAPAAAMMLAGAALMLTQQISSETGNWMNDAVAEVFQAFGMDEKSAQIAANVAIMVAGIALSLGAGGPRQRLLQPQRLR